MCNQCSCQCQSSSESIARAGAPSREGDVRATRSIPILSQSQTFKKDIIKETHKTKNKQTKAKENKVEKWRHFLKISQL